MKQFLDEQETAAKPPEPRGDRTPREATQSVLEEESGETLLDEIMPEEPDAAEENEEKVEWDGSEAELVADEGASEYEEQNTGIKLEYSLKSEEIFKAMLKNQYTQMRIALSAAAVLLSLVMIVSSVRASVMGDGRFGLMAALCAALILITVGIPLVSTSRLAKKAAVDNKVRMKIYPDHIVMGRDSTSWEIPLDGTRERTVLQNLIILYIDAKNMVILPLRCVEPAVLPEVQAMIFAGTQPTK